MQLESLIKCYIQLAIDWCISHFCANPDSLSLWTAMLCYSDLIGIVPQTQADNMGPSCSLRHNVQLSVDQALESLVSSLSCPFACEVAEVCGKKLDCLPIRRIPKNGGMTHKKLPCLDMFWPWHKFGMHCHMKPLTGRTWHTVMSLIIEGEPLDTSHLSIFNLHLGCFSPEAFEWSPGSLPKGQANTDRIPSVLLPGCRKSARKIIQVVPMCTNSIQFILIFLVWHHFRSFPGWDTKEIGRTTEVPWQTQNHSICQHGSFHTWGDPKMDDLGVPPFSEPPYLTTHKLHIFCSRRSFPVGTCLGTLGRSSTKERDVRHYGLRVETWLQEKRWGKYPKLMVDLEFPWFSMIFHDLPWSSMIFHYPKMATIGRYTIFSDTLTSSWSLRWIVSWSKEEIVESDRQPILEKFGFKTVPDPGTQLRLLPSDLWAVAFKWNTSFPSLSSSSLLGKNRLRNSQHLFVVKIRILHLGILKAFFSLNAPKWILSPYQRDANIDFFFPLL